jgi:hypothetical protein
MRIYILLLLSNVISMRSHPQRLDECWLNARISRDTRSGKQGKQPRGAAECCRLAAPFAQEFKPSKLPSWTGSNKRQSKKWGLRAVAPSLPRERPPGIGSTSGIDFLLLEISQPDHLVEHTLGNFPFRALRHFHHFVFGQDGDGITTGVETNPCA